MKNERYNPFSQTLNNQKGVSAILVAILLPVLIGFAALAIDVGYMYTTKNELQNIADGAALAGANQLGQIYLSLPQTSHADFELEPGSADETSITDAVRLVAERNQAAGTSIEIRLEDIYIGVWNFATDTFTEQSNSPYAVRVVARRDSLINTRVNSFFGKIFSFFGGNFDTFAASALATASLSSPSNIVEGLSMPVGLSYLNFPDNCSSPITFGSTKTSCAGWHNFSESSTSTTALRNMMLGIIANHTVTDPDIPIPPDGIMNGNDWLEEYFGITNQPPRDIGVVDLNNDDLNSFYFLGGGSSLLNGQTLREELPWAGDKYDVPPEVVTPIDTGLIAYFPALFDYFRMRDGDNDNSIWTGLVPVYNDGATCSNPNTEMKIVGFARIKVLDYAGPPDNSITVEIICDYAVEEGRSGGGFDYGGVYGSIANLVE